MVTIDRIRLALSIGAGALSLLGVLAIGAQQSKTEWIPACVGAAIFLGLKEQLRKFRRSYVTGCKSVEVD